MHILVVEDEKKVASFIKRGLEAANYSVDVEHDGETGLNRLLKTDYDLVILDVMLPRVDGLSLMKEIRQRRIEVPVLLLTARVTVADRVMGLDLGADDYLTKPFAFEELLARVRALLRRGAAAVPAVLAIADLRLDPATREVTRSNQRIDLTPKEYALLEFLLRRRDQVLSRAVIAQHVWGVNYDTFTNVIERLRELSPQQNRRRLRAQIDPYRARRGLCAEGRAVGSMNWPFTTLRGRLILWYTAILSAMLALLGATSVMMLDHGLRTNIDDSLNSVARAIADSVRRPSFFPPGIEEKLESMLGPQLAERFFQLLDRYGQPDPRLVPTGKIEATSERGSVTECGERRSDIGNSGTSPKARKAVPALDVSCG